MMHALDRRMFLKATGAAALGTMLGLEGAPRARGAAADGTDAAWTPTPLMWGYLIHLGYNMWADRTVPGTKRDDWSSTATLRCERDIWRQVTEAAALHGVNTLVIDLGEGVRYASHPEIGIEGSWTPEQLREELRRIRELGMQPIPKLNFSTGHDAWLGKYERMVSTPEYYRVCADLIAEALELFDGPPLFHLGMDEETAADQKDYGHVVIRQHENWWEDLHKLLGWVEAGGARPWVWADYEWRHPELFYEQMPRSVLLSNWYYNNQFRADDFGVMAYAELDAAGYDQVPTASNWSKDDNMALTAEYCRERIAPERLKGFLQTSWKATTARHLERHVAALEQLATARRAFEKPRP